MSTFRSLSVEEADQLSLSDVARDWFAANNGSRPSALAGGTSSSASSSSSPAVHPLRRYLPLMEKISDAFGTVTQSYEKDVFKKDQLSVTVLKRHASGQGGQQFAAMAVLAGRPLARGLRDFVASHKPAVDVTVDDLMQAAEEAFEAFLEWTDARAAYEEARAAVRADVAARRAASVASPSSTTDGSSSSPSSSSAGSSSSSSSSSPAGTRQLSATEQLRESSSLLSLNDNTAKALASASDGLKKHYAEVTALYPAVAPLLLLLLFHAHDKSLEFRAVVVQVLRATLKPLLDALDTRRRPAGAQAVLDKWLVAATSLDTSRVEEAERDTLVTMMDTVATQVASGILELAVPVPSASSVPTWVAAHRQLRDLRVALAATKTEPPVKLPPLSFAALVAALTKASERSGPAVFDTVDKFILSPSADTFDALVARFEIHPSGARALFPASSSVNQVRAAPAPAPNRTVHGMHLPACQPSLAGPCPGVSAGSGPLQAYPCLTCCLCPQGASVKVMPDGQLRLPSCPHDPKKNKGSPPVYRLTQAAYARYKAYNKKKSSSSTTTPAPQPPSNSSSVGSVAAASEDSATYAYQSDLPSTYASSLCRGAPYDPSLPYGDPAGTARAFVPPVTQPSSIATEPPALPPPPRTPGQTACPWKPVLEAPRHYAAIENTIPNMLKALKLAKAEIGPEFMQLVVEGPSPTRALPPAIADKYYAHFAHARFDGKGSPSACRWCFLRPSLLAKHHQTAAGLPVFVNLVLCATCMPNWDALHVHADACEDDERRCPTHLWTSPGAGKARASDDAAAELATPTLRATVAAVTNERVTDNDADVPMLVDVTQPLGFFTLLNERTRAQLRLLSFLDNGSCASFIDTRFMNKVGASLCTEWPANTPSLYAFGRQRIDVLGYVVLKVLGSDGVFRDTSFHVVEDLGDVAVLLGRNALGPNPFESKIAIDLLNGALPPPISAPPADVNSIVVSPFDDRGVIFRSIEMISFLDGNVSLHSTVEVRPLQPLAASVAAAAPLGMQPIATPTPPAPKPATVDLPFRAPPPHAWRTAVRKAIDSTSSWVSQLRMTGMCLQYWERISDATLPSGVARHVITNIQLRAGVDPASIFDKPRSYTAEQRAAIDTFVRELTQAGLLRPSTSPCQSVPIIIPKLDKNDNIIGWRIAVDYRRLNAATERDRYPLPFVIDLVRRLTHYKFKSVIDAKCHFYHAPLADLCAMLTATNFNGVLLEWTVSPLGLINMPSVAQRWMDVVCDIDAFFSYIDDMMVGGMTELEHNANLRHAFQRLHCANITISATKMQLGRTTVEALGYEIVERDGKHFYRPLGQRINVLTNLAMPKTKTELRHWLHMIQHYSPHINNFTVHALRLRLFLSRTQRPSMDDMDAEDRQALEALRSGLRNAFSFHPFEPNRGPVRVFTDWSKEGMAWIVEQQHEDGRYYVVTANTRKCTKAEANYGSSDGELQAFRLCCRENGDILRARPFTWITDSELNMHASSGSSADGRYNQRRIHTFEELLSMPWTAVHRDGKDMANVDVPSRFPHLVGVVATVASADWTIEDWARVDSPAFHFGSLAFPQASVAVVESSPVSDALDASPLVSDALDASMPSLVSPRAARPMLDADVAVAPVLALEVADVALAPVPPPPPANPWPEFTNEDYDYHVARAIGPHDSPETRATERARIKELVDSQRADDALRLYAEFARRRALDPAALPPNDTVGHVDAKFDRGLLLVNAAVALGSDMAQGWLLPAHMALGHASSRPMRVFAAGRVWWPGITADISEFCAACMTCQQQRVRHKDLGGRPTPVPAVGISWQADLMDVKKATTAGSSSGNVAPNALDNAKYIAFFIDSASRFTFAMPIPDKTPASVYAAYSAVRAVVGVMRVIKVDPGSEYLGIFREAVEFDGTDVLTTVAGDHNGSSIVENVIGIFGARLTKLMPQDEKGRLDMANWMLFVNEVTLAYNATPTSDGGPSPFLAFHGREPRLSPDNFYASPCPSPSSLVDDMLERERRRQQALLEIEEHRRREHERRAPKLPKFEIGQLVLAPPSTPNTKLQGRLRYGGKARVIGLDHNGMRVTVANPDTNKKIGEFSARQLSPFVKPVRPNVIAALEQGYLDGGARVPADLLVNHLLEEAGVPAGKAAVDEANDDEVDEEVDDHDDDDDDADFKPSSSSSSSSSLAKSVRRSARLAHPQK